MDLVDLKHNVIKIECNRGLQYCSEHFATKGLTSSNFENMSFKHINHINQLSHLFA